MKAIVQDKYGSPDVLELRAIDKPVIRDDEGLVRVRAAGVNIGDWHLLRGVPYGWCRGAFAEYACAAESNLLPKPANLTFEQSAAVGDSAFTALAAVRDQGKVQAGQRVLINGASGGVGTFAVQIAKSLGARVTGVCSTRNIDLVRR